MKLFAVINALLATSTVSAFGSFGKKAKAPAKVAAPAPATGFQKTIVVEDLPGVLPPIGFFDPLGLAAKADDNLIRKYREAELTHGRIAMIATIGFLTGELVQGVTPILDGTIKGAGILQPAQLPAPWLITFAVTTFAVETARVQRAIYDPTSCTEEQFGKYRPDYIPGDLGFDPLGLKPNDPEEFKKKQTKELQNGRLAMLAASGFLAQELSDKKGIVESLVDRLPAGLVDGLVDTVKELIPEEIVGLLPF